MITKLKAENFQKHESIEIEFTGSGMTLICGENWAGKTTILRAILYGLFGPSGIPGGAKAAQRHGCPSKPVVELSFTLDADYLVRRTASVTRLFKNAEMVANGTRPVNDSLRELLGMDAQTFALLKYAPQEQAGAILTLGAEKLGKLINQITGVTLVEQVIDKASHEGSVARSMLEQLEVTDPEPLQNQLTTLGEHLTAKHAEISKLETSINEMSQNVQGEEQTTQKLARRWEAKQKSEAEAASLRGRVQTLKQHLETQPEDCQVPDLDKLSGAVRELEALHNAEVSRGTRQNEIAKQVAVLTEQKEVEEAWLKECGHAYLKGSPNERQMEEYQRQEQEADDRVRSSYDKEIQVRVMLDESVCPTCERPLEGADLEELSDRIDAAVKDYAECAEAYMQISKTVVQARQQRELSAQYQQTDHELRQTLQTLKDLQQESEEISNSYEADLSVLEDALHTARQDLQNARVAYETNQRYQEQKARITRELAEAKANLASIEASMDPVTFEHVERLRTKLLKAQAELRESERQRYQGLEQYQREYADYMALHTRLEAALDSQSKLKGLQGRAQLCAKLAKYLRTNRDRFTKEVWQALLVSASSFAQLATGGQICSVSRTDEGAFEYVEDDRKMTVEAASGVQRAILGVGVRLAIAEALRSPVDFLLLDEVTAGATDEVSLSMSRTLAHAQQQVLMVTHRQSDAAVANSLISI